MFCPMNYTVAAFYQFTPLPDAPALRLALKDSLTPLGLCGTLLVAPEGINGTLAGSAEAVDTLLAILNAEVSLPRAAVKFSHATEKPFHRLKVRLKREILTFGQPQADPSVQTGTPVAPSDWNALLADPAVLLLDTRNTYETRLGSFAGATDPSLLQFTDFVDYARQTLDPARHPKIAMFCTGGIRCEKASSFLLSEGFVEVYQLEGGILKYLEEVPAAESRWEGDCYVFDHRMAVGPGLSTGDYAMCFACGEALTEADRIHPRFEEGASCHFCFEKTSDADKARFRMRHTHLSPAMSGISE